MPLTPRFSSSPSGKAVLAAALLLPLPVAGQEAGALSEQVANAVAFRPIGPVNPSGRVTALAAPPGQAKTLYAGFASSGLWKTVNHGTTWTPVFDDQGTATVGDVAVAPSDPEVVWLGTGERNSLRSNAWGDGVYRSTDGGRTWEHRGLAETRQTGRIVVHPDDPETVWVGALGHLWGANEERGVYKTSDGGETWRKTLFVDDTSGVVDLKAAPDDPSTLYAATWHRLRWGGGRMEGAGAGSGIWRSTDGGETWTELTAPDGGRGLPTDRMGRIGLAVTPADPDRVYAVIQVSRSAFGPSISEHGGVFRSEDRGESWTRVHDMSAIPDYFYNELWVDPVDPDRIYAGATRMAVSEDAGETWETQRWDDVHVDHHALWIDPDDPGHLVLGNDGGVYVSWDRGETWEHQLIPAGQAYETAVDTTRVPYHVCVGMQDNGTWCGPSRTREEEGITHYDWYAVWGGDGFHHAVSPDAPHIRYGESQYGFWGRLDTETMERTLLRPHAEDSGAESGYEFRFDWDSPFQISHHDPSTLWFGGNHLFRYTDRGGDWEIVGPDMTRGSRFAPEPDSAHTSYRSLHAIAESTLTADVVWTGSNDGLIWVSRDGGGSWTEVARNVPDERPRRCWVGEIEASAHDPARAYVAYDCHRRDDYRPYVFRTDDFGSTWTDVTGDLPGDGGSYVVRESPVNPDLLLVGTEKGVWVSNTGGGTWVRMSNGLPTVPVRDMDWVPRAREVAVGTYGRSVYVLPVAVLEEATPEALAEDVHLFQARPARQYRTQDTYGSHGDHFYAAPNPPYGATLWYHLADDVDGDVEIKISGAGGDGEALATLTGPGEAGLRSVQWDLRRDEPRPRRLGDPTDEESLRRVGAGEYEVTLTAGGETRTVTLTVLEGWEERGPRRLE